MLNCWNFLKTGFYEGINLERTLSKSWDGQIRRRDASRPVFWTLAHIRWLEEGQLGDQIEETLLRGGGRDSTEDQRTRNLLRRVGGLPHVRGKVSVLSDSPISRAWWRGSVASEIADAAADDITSTWVMSWVAFSSWQVSATCTSYPFPLWPL